MNKRWLLLAGSLVLVLALGYLFLRPVVNPSTENSHEQPAEAAKIQSKMENQASDASEKEDSNSTPHLKLPQGEEVSIPSTPEISNQEEAQELVNQEVSKLQLGDGSKLLVGGHSSDENDNDYYHLNQTYKGIPVYGASAVLEIEQGKARELSGNWFKDIELDTQPSYSAKEALQKALIKLGVPTNRQVELIGNASLTILVTEDVAHLCWKMQAFLTNPDSKAEAFIVDAHEPQIILRRDLFES